MMFTRMVDEIIGVCKDLGISLKKRPVFGTLSTGRVNGMAVDFASSKYQIILIEDGLLGFANLFAKIIAQMFPPTQGTEEHLAFSTEPSQVKANIDAQPIIARRLFDVVAGYLIYGNPHAAEQYLPTAQVMALSSAWRPAMEYFVLGHEFGHCSAGHLEQGRRQLSALSVEGNDQMSGELRLEEILPLDWKQELEADALGLAIALSVMNKAHRFPPNLTYAGIESFFSCIDLMERGGSILTNGTRSTRLSSTHPPAEIRRQALRIGLRHMAGDDQANGCIQFADQMGVGIEYAWQKIEGKFLQMHRDGIRPGARWLA
jgi:hypothetical protein